MGSLFRRVAEECGYLIYEVDTEGYSVHIEKPNVYESLDELLDKNDYTDIIIMIHGWNTGYEPNGTLTFGNELVLEMDKQKPESVKPLYICVKWPSELGNSFGWIYNIFFGEPKTKLNYREQSKAMWESRGMAVPEGFKLDDMDATEKHHIREGAIIHGSAALLAAIERTTNAETAMRSMKDFSFGQFMRRAYTVGSRGVHLLIAKLMERTSKDVKFHVHGFSMGACVAMAAAIGRAPGSLLPRKLHSLFICQGAVPSKSMGLGNQFRPLVSFLKPVAGTMMFTNTSKDTALIAYRIARSDNGRMRTENAAGFNGVEGTAPVTAISCDIRQFSSYCCEVVPGKIYNLNCDSIPSLDHFCYSKPDIVAAFWKGATLELEESAYEVINNVDLPSGYWTNFDVRTK